MVKIVGGKIVPDVEMSTVGAPQAAVAAPAVGAGDSSVFARRINFCGQPMQAWHLALILVLLYVLFGWQGVAVFAILIALSYFYSPGALAGDVPPESATGGGGRRLGGVRTVHDLPHTHAPGGR